MRPGEHQFFSEPICCIYMLSHQQINVACQVFVHVEAQAVVGTTRLMPQDVWRGSQDSKNRER